MTLDAHHSTNANFTQEIVSVEGTIERVRFRSSRIGSDQHVDAEGQEVFWLIESGANA